MRYPIDIKELGILLDLWKQGCEMLESIISNITDKRKLENAERLYCLGKYILNSVKTVVNMSFRAKCIENRKFME